MEKLLQWGFIALACVSGFLAELDPLTIVLGFLAGAALVAAAAS